MFKMGVSRDNSALPLPLLRRLKIVLHYSGSFGRRGTVVIASNLGINIVLAFSICILAPDSAKPGKKQLFRKIATPGSLLVLESIASAGCAGQR
jgi:hypothetical protein